jgi:hypothetical protein
MFDDPHKKAFCHAATNFAGRVAEDLKAVFGPQHVRRYDLLKGAHNPSPNPCPHCDCIESAYLA